MKKDTPTKAIESSYIAPKLANYKDVAEKFIESPEYDINDLAEFAIKKFAKHLDSFQTLNSQMQVLALQASLKKYMQFYDIIKTDIAPEILEPCMDKFKALNKKK